MNLGFRERGTSLVELMISVSIGAVVWLAAGDWVQRVYALSKSSEALEESLNGLRFVEASVRTALSSGFPTVSVDRDAAGGTETVFITKSSGKSLRLRNLCLVHSRKDLSAATLKRAMIDLSAGQMFPPLEGCRPVCTGNDEYPVIELQLEESGVTRRTNFPASSMRHVGGAFLCTRNLGYRDFVGNVENKMLLSVVAAFEKPRTAPGQTAAERVGWQAVSVGLH